MLAAAIVFERCIDRFDVDIVRYDMDEPGLGGSEYISLVRDLASVGFVPKYCGSPVCPGSALRPPEAVPPYRRSIFCSLLRVSRLS